MPLLTSHFLSTDLNRCYWQLDYTLGQTYWLSSNLDTNPENEVHILREMVAKKGAHHEQPCERRQLTFWILQCEEVKKKLKPSREANNQLPKKSLPTNTKTFLEVEKQGYKPQWQL